MSQLRRYAIVDETGRITGIARCHPSADQTGRMMPVDDDVSDTTHRVIDGKVVPYTEEQQAALLSPPPWANRWDAAECKWVDTLTLEQMRARQWDRVKLWRSEAERAGVSYMGRTFQSDSASRLAVLSAALTTMMSLTGQAAEFDWLDIENRVLSMTAGDMRGLAIVMAEHAAAMHQKAQLLRSMIDTAQTKDEILTVVW